MTQSQGPFNFALAHPSLHCLHRMNLSAPGNEDAPASAIKSVSYLRRQVDIYWQSVGYRRKGERLPVQKAVTLVWMQCHQPKPSLLQMYSILFKGKQISATECHGKDTSPAS